MNIIRFTYVSVFLTFAFKAGEPINIVNRKIRIRHCCMCGLKRKDFYSHVILVKEGSSFEEEWGICTRCKDKTRFVDIEWIFPIIIETVTRVSKDFL